MRTRAREEWRVVHGEGEVSELGWPKQHYASHSCVQEARRSKRSVIATGQHGTDKRLLLQLSTANTFFSAAALCSWRVLSSSTSCVLRALLASRRSHHVSMVASQRLVFEAKGEERRGAGGRGDRGGWCIVVEVSPHALSRVTRKR